MNTVSTDWAGIDCPVWLERAKGFTLTALGQMQKENWVVSLLFCDDDFIQTLNQNYRQKDEPTDVLSFPLGDTVEQEGGSVFLAGDIVISLPALQRNAVDFSVSPNEELKRLILHGLLHLSGMDHITNALDEPMLALQETILTQLSGEQIL